MADKGRRARAERPIHLAGTDEGLEHEQDPAPAGGRAIHARDGSEQPRLDDQAATGRRGSGSGTRASRDVRDVGQFTGEGQPAREKK